MTTPASLPDAELVRLARAGQRNAFAVLYHRYVRQVHALVTSGSADATAAETTTVAVFCDLLRHLEELDPAHVAPVLQQHASRRIRGHAGGPGIPPLTVGALDRMWREIDRRWPSGDAPRRDVGTMVPITAGALAAVMVLAALASTPRRSGVPDPNRSLEAIAVQTEVAPDLLPGLPGPRVTAADTDAEPEPTAAAPTTAPSPDPTVAAPTEEPTEAPTTEQPPSEEPDRAPEVTIHSPTDGSTRVSEGEDERGAYATVTLDGAATDDRDPAEALAYSWTSSLEGALATTPGATVRLHVPEGQLTASHVLTFSVTDSTGNTASSSVTVVVTRV
ncbi:MAG: hypothetical protein KY461_10760 [Actinobacteria bacterium]|nr:hypothetical protein [Actinomycetota bacterium]